MDIEDYINEEIFHDDGNRHVFYKYIWEIFSESGYVIPDENESEIDCIFKAVAMKYILSEFEFRLFDCANDMDANTITDYLLNIGKNEEEINDYLNSQTNASEYDELTQGIEITLNCLTRETAEKMLEEFSADELFDLMFTATYDFELDFTYNFEDSDELCAFIEANQDKLELYKDEFSSVLDWINEGMIC